MENVSFEFPTAIDLTQFVSVQAHDLRSPFNQIVGFTKIMLNGQDGPISDLQREDLGTVYKSSLRALGLMSGLIDIARLNRGEKGPSAAPVAVAPLLDAALAQWKKYNPAKDVKVAGQLLARTPELVADETQIRQILQHLIAYVLEYVDEPARVVVTVAEEPGRFVVSVEGTGTPRHVQSKFDLEMLGYVSRALIELNGGQICKGHTTATGAVVAFALPQVARP